MSEGQRGLGTKVPLKESKFEYYLDCEATALRILLPIARNDEAAFESPSGSQREPAPLAGSKIYSHAEDTFIL